MRRHDRVWGVLAALSLIPRPRHSEKARRGTQRGPTPPRTHDAQARRPEDTATRNTHPRGGGRGAEAREKGALEEGEVPRAQGLSDPGRRVCRIELAPGFMVESGRSPAAKFLDDPPLPALSQVASIASGIANE
jgi:hypothetical protein